MEVGGSQMKEAGGSAMFSLPKLASGSLEELFLQVGGGGRGVPFSLSSSLVFTFTSLSLYIRGSLPLNTGN
jgi:hypothetical protein